MTHMWSIQRPPLSEILQIKKQILIQKRKKQIQIQNQKKLACDIFSGGSPFLLGGTRPHWGHRSWSLVYLYDDASNVITNDDGKDKNHEEKDSEGEFADGSNKIDQ